MPKSNDTLQPWQIFRVAIKTIPVPELCQIFGKSHIRTIYLYGQDPDTTEQRCKGPLEQLRQMFDRLDERGRGDVAMAGIAYLSDNLIDEHPHKVEALQKTIEGEVNKDFAAVAHMAKLIDEQADPVAVKLALHEAKEELDRTYAKYLQGLGQ